MRLNNTTTQKMALLLMLLLLCTQTIVLAQESAEWPQSSEVAITDSLDSQLNDSNTSHEGECQDTESTCDNCHHCHGTHATILTSTIEFSPNDPFKPDFTFTPPSPSPKVEGIDRPPAAIHL